MIHFPNFCGVIWFYEINLEVAVGFCMFFVVYMFSKQISYRNRIGRQLLGDFEPAEELADSFSPVLASDKIMHEENYVKIGLSAPEILLPFCSLLSYLSR